MGGEAEANVRMTKMAKAARRTVSMQTHRLPTALLLKSNTLKRKKIFCNKCPIREAAKKK